MAPRRRRPVLQAIKGSKPRRRRMARPEQAMQTGLIKSLALILTAETRVVHVPNGGYRKKVEAAILIGMGVMPGFPDLLFISRGRAYGIELKTGDGELSDDQQEAYPVLIRAGMPIAVCRTAPEVIQQIRAWGIPTRIKNESDRALAA